MIAFLKWLATAVLIVGAGVNGLGYYPLGPLMLVAGGMIWMIVAVKLRDWALVTTNAVMGLVGLATVVYTLFYMEIDDAVEEMQPQTCPEFEVPILRPGSEHTKLG